jgi:hypothetical protein
MVAARARLVLGEERLEGAAPAVRERRDGERAAQSCGCVPRQIDEGADLTDAHRARAHGDPFDPVAGPDPALVEDAHIEAGTPVLVEQHRHASLTEAHPDLEAGHARLGDLKQRTTNAVPVADADLVVGHPFDREVLAEAPATQIVSSQEA